MQSLTDGWNSLSLNRKRRPKSKIVVAIAQHTIPNIPAPASNADISFYNASKLYPSVKEETLLKPKYPEVVCEKI